MTRTPSRRRYRPVYAGCTADPKRGRSRIYRYFWRFHARGRILRKQCAGVAKWQTQQTQNLPPSRACGFKSLLRHQPVHAPLWLYSHGRGGGAYQWDHFQAPRFSALASTSNSLSF